MKKTKTEVPPFLDIPQLQTIIESDILDAETMKNLRATSRGIKGQLDTQYLHNLYLQTRQSRIKTFIKTLEKYDLDYDELFVLLFGLGNDQESKNLREGLIQIPIFKDMMSLNTGVFHNAPKWRLAIYHAYDTYYRVGSHYAEMNPIEALEYSKDIINRVGRVLSDPLVDPDLNQITPKQNKEIKTILKQCYQNDQQPVEKQCNLYDWFQIFMVFTREQLLNHDLDEYLESS